MVNCNTLWARASFVVPTNQKDAFKKSSMIRINCDGKVTECVNPKVLNEKGWCETTDAGGKWGICSPACQSFDTETVTILISSFLYIIICKYQKTSNFGKY